MKTKSFCFYSLATKNPSVSEHVWSSLDIILDKASKLPRGEFVSGKEEKTLKDIFLQLPQSPGTTNMFKVLFAPFVSHEFKIQEKMPVFKDKIVWTDSFLKAIERVHDLSNSLTIPQHRSLIHDLINFLNLTGKNPKSLDLIIKWSGKFPEVQKSISFYLMESLNIHFVKPSLDPFTLKPQQREDFKNKVFSSLKEIEDLIDSLHDGSWGIKENVRVRHDSYGYLSSPVTLKGGVFNSYEMSFDPQPWLTQRFWRNKIMNFNLPDHIPGLFFNIRAEKAIIKEFLKKNPRYGAGLFFREKDFSIEDLSKGPELSFNLLKTVKDENIEEALKWTKGEKTNVQWLMFNTHGSFLYRRSVFMEFLKHDPDSFELKQALNFTIHTPLSSKNKFVVRFCYIYLKNNGQEELLSELVSNITKNIPLLEPGLEEYISLIPDDLLTPVRIRIERDNRGAQPGSLISKALDELRRQSIRSQKKPVKLQGIFKGK